MTDDRYETGLRVRREVLGADHVLVVGEEAASADPALLDRLVEGFVWLVDPLDGTSNYVSGDKRFATMVALLHDGDPLIGYIHAPAEGRTSLSTRGARPRTVRKGMTPPVGSAFARYFAEPLRAQVEARMAVLPTVSEGGRCVGCEYQDIVAGRQDFALFWRSMPWDHAAGSLLVQGCGGYVAYLDDTPYRPGARRFGLLAACDEPTWRLARSMLVEGVDDPAGLLVREHDDY